MFNWFKVLWRLEDDHIQKMNGIDYTLYLVFLRYAAWLCLVITVIDVVIFFPLYATGHPTSKDKWSTMNRLTFLNITANDGKCIFVYVFTLLVISALAFLVLYWFQRKYYSYKEKLDPVHQDLCDIQIARFSIYFKGLPTNVGVEELQRAITTKMQKLYPVDESGASLFVKARVIGDYNSLYKKCVKLKKLIEKLEGIRARNRASGKRVTIRKRNWLCQASDIDAVDLYVEQINALK